MVHARTTVVALCLLAGTPALACPSGADYFSFDSSSSTPIPRLRKHGGRARAAIGLAPDFVYMSVDGDGLRAWGVRTEARVQHEQLAFVVDAAIYNAGQSEPGPRGYPHTLARAGAALRWEPAAWKMDASAVVAAFVELGAGLQRWTFADTTARQRPDATLGVGLHVHGGSMDSRDTRHLGVTILARVITAHGTEPRSGIALRQTTATPDERADLGVEAGLAVTWGRRGRPSTRLSAAP